MKKKSFISATAALLAGLSLILALAACEPSPPAAAQLPIESGKKLTMFVTSDIHYLAPSLHDDGAAYQSYVSTGDGKQMNYIDEIVDAFSRDIGTARPDVLIISGDLTSNGEKESHLKLAEKLKKIEETSGTRVYVIPGNHDIENPFARAFQGGKQVVTDYIGAKDFSNIYRDFGYAEAISRDKTTLSYLAAPSKDVWLLMLDTCTYKTNLEYGSPAIYGQISPATFDWMRQCAQRAKESNARIVTVMHHNLLRHNYAMYNGYTLDNGDEAVKVFRELGLNLTLSGHTHVQDVKVNKDDGDPIYDVVTSALPIYPQQYGVLRYQSGQGFEYSTRRADVEGWAKATGSQDKNLTGFAAYSQQYFSDAAYKKAYGWLADTDVYTKEQKASMADTVRLLNLNYFGGTVSQIRDEIEQTPGYKLWMNAEGPERMVKYVQSMMYDYGMDNNHLKID